MSTFPLLLLQALSLYYAAAQAQTDPYDTNSIPLCNKTFADANGTGVFPFDPSVNLLVKDNSRVSWELTLLEDSPQNNVVATSFWYNTGGISYSGGLALGYDVCAVIIYEGVTENIHLRSQYDNGSCVATFDAECTGAFQRQAEDLAMQVVRWPTPLPDSNLTADSLPGVCDSIAASLVASLPKQCEPYFDVETYRPVGLALTTDYNRTGLFFGTPGPNCSIKASAPSNQSFYAVGSFIDAETSADGHETYDLAGAGTVAPILTAFMPVADARRMWTVDSATAVMSCLRITDYNPGSRVPAKAGEPTPVPLHTSSKALSGGAIAGIVFGSVVAVGIIAMVISLWRRRLRTSKKDVTQNSPHTILATPHEKDATSTIAELTSDNSRYELSPESYWKPELPDSGCREPMELEANRDLGPDSLKRSS